MVPSRSHHRSRAVADVKKQDTTASLSATPSPSMNSESELSGASSDEDSEDDPLSDLIGRSKEVLSTLPAKRPCLFTVRDGQKILKAPPTSSAPFAPPAVSLDLMRRSDALMKKHEKDDEEAMSAVKEEEDFDKMLKESLDHRAYDNLDYVTYIKSHRNTIKMKDFFYLATSRSYFKSDTVKFPSILFAIPGAIAPGEKFDVFNEVDPLRIVKEADQLMFGDADKAYTISYLRRIGADPTIQTVNESHIKLDSKRRLPEVPLVLSQIYYLIKEITQSPYDDACMEVVIRVLGLVMMDTRVFNYNTTFFFQTMLTDIIEYIIDKTETLPYERLVTIWKGLTDSPELRVRILETIPPQPSRKLYHLRKMYALSMIGPTPMAEDTALSGEQLSSMCCMAISTAFATLSGQDLELTEQQYIEWTYKFKAILYLIQMNDRNNRMTNVASGLEKLMNKIRLSFQEKEQAQCRAMMVLLSLVLEDKQVRMKSIFG
ncbi:CYFA0S09e04621g1_1 [Cyberlindnera fabianii]|uniref:CYFA0S09e04621g1_1 n=1 Tax=Cyberlindnera fabianii TaxID=36022 RepID=A0A061AYA2_CYBFA|nr:CYFA0S09e04621g1_1 [Cyberlindnera fabianii]